MYNFKFFGCIVRIVGVCLNLVVDKVHEDALVFLQGTPKCKNLKWKKFRNWNFSVNKLTVSLDVRPLPDGSLKFELTTNYISINGKWIAG